MAIRLGDRPAFKTLYDRFGGELLALCERIVHNRADAEDVVAEVFWEVWRRRERYDPGRGEARPYLTTLTRSRAIDRLRSQAARPESKNESRREMAADLSLAASDRSPEEAVLVGELHARVADALAGLDPRQRQAMELAYYEGLSHQQIANRLDSPLGTVKTHIRKGLAKLRVAMKIPRTEQQT